MKDSRADEGTTGQKSARRVAGRLRAMAIWAAFLAGCSTMGPTHTGFLSDYSKLSPTTSRINRGIGLHRVEVKLPEPGQMDAIDSFTIEPVAWSVARKDWLGANEDRRERVEARLDEALRERLGAIRPIVDKPGPRTAVVRAAVTDVKSSRPILNTLATVVPPVVAGPFWFFGPQTNGGASVEAEIRGPDGRQIAAVDGGSSGGYFDLVGYYTRSGHPKKAAMRLAGELADAVESRSKLKPAVPAPAPLPPLPR